MTGTSAGPSRPSTAPALQDGGSRHDSPVRRRSTPAQPRCSVGRTSNRFPAGSCICSPIHCPTPPAATPRDPTPSWWPSGKRAGAFWRSRGSGTPFRSANSWRGPPTWWMASVTGASSRRGWPAPWTRVCSNRPRNYCGWPCNSGRVSCTPPHTSSMDWWSGPWPMPWASRGCTRSAASWQTRGPPRGGLRHGTAKSTRNSRPGKPKSCATPIWW
ncbi:hypothetical protein SRABI128_06316 [Microbacterium sp. Bi128]|nr:hypothetical protein SRABI128_06316 [Microbacterium sp. Bi128]